MSISRFYRRVSAASLEELVSFRAEHPYRTALVRGTEWRYLVGGEGEPILLLPGSSCIAEMGWRTIRGLEKGFRVVSPDYPALRNNADLVAGILGLLDREGINKVHIMGGSAGGLAAQYLVRHYPDRATSLILSHTVVPLPRTGTRLTRTLVLLRGLPEWAARWFLTARMRRLLPWPRTPAVSLMWAHFLEVIRTQVTRSQILALVERSAELALSQELGPADAASWPGRVLIILSKNDPAAPEHRQKALLEKYPTAVVRRFEGTGHVTSTEEPARFVAAVEEFLRP